MNVESFIKAIDADFFTGVPDSQLKAVCNYLISTYGIDKEHHMIAANEGNCTAIAAGYHLATGRVPVVYMQNSGEGNIINPVASLCNEKVYGIPVLFVIGWRGEPGVHDEPQHIFQGEVTLKLLEDMNIEHYIIDKTTTVDDINNVMSQFRVLFAAGKQAAFVVKKDSLTFDQKIEYQNNNKVLREDIIKTIVDYAGNDMIVSTTGKASRELFEIRELRGEDHSHDFLTVGSMGHSSSIALGIASQKPDKRVWIIDGDGAALMHMGSMAIIGSMNLNNMVHIVINNGAHESVGGMPTVASAISLTKIAMACGYQYVAHVKSLKQLEKTLDLVRNSNVLSFIEIDSAIGSRADLGRPTTTAKENKEKFMEKLCNCRRTRGDKEI